MKYLIVLVLMCMPFLVKAETTYFFLNGSGYNDNGVLTHYRFLDGKCYDVNGTYTPECSIDLLSVITPIDLPVVIPTSTEPSIPEPTHPVATATPNSPIVGGEPQLLPTYSETELHNIFCEAFQEQDCTNNWVHAWPAQESLGNDKSERFFTPNGPYTLYSNIQIELNGITLPLDSSPVFNDLNPNISYTYSLIYSEAGRADSILTLPINSSFLAN